MMKYLATLFLIALLVSNVTSDRTSEANEEEIYGSGLYFLATGLALAGRKLIHANRAKTAAAGNPDAYVAHNKLRDAYVAFSKGFSKDLGKLLDNVDEKKIENAEVRKELESLKKKWRKEIDEGDGKYQQNTGNHVNRNAKKNKEEPAIVQAKKKENLLASIKTFAKRFIKIQTVGNLLASSAGMTLWTFYQALTLMDTRTLKKDTVALLSGDKEFNHIAHADVVAGDEDLRTTLCQTVSELYTELRFIKVSVDKHVKVDASTQNMWDHMAIQAQYVWQCNCVKDQKKKKENPKKLPRNALIEIAGVQRRRKHRKSETIQRKCNKSKHQRKGTISTNSCCKSIEKDR